jgi:hypothetical protein
MSEILMSMDVAGHLVCLGYNYYDRFSAEEMSRGQGLRILDVTDPASPVCLSDKRVGAEPGTLALRISDQRVFVATQQSTGLQVFDLADPKQPVLLGQTEPSFPFEDVRISGDVAYVAHDSGLEVFDIIYPGRPVQRSSVWFEYSSLDDCDT